MSFSHVTHFVHIQVRPDLETDFQTHFSPILDLLSNCLDCEHVEPKWYFDIDLRSIPIDCLEKKENRFESRYVSKYRPGRNCNLLSPTTDWKRYYGAYNSFWKNTFEWDDFRMVWYEFVLKNWHFRTFFLILIAYSKSPSCASFWGFDRFELFDVLKIRRIRSNFWLDFVNSLKRMHIRPPGNRLFRMFFVRSFCRPRISNISKL